MASSHCVENPPVLNPSSGQGRVEQLGGLHTYLTGSEDSRLAIILISDVFGYESPKLRALADEVAAAGFLAVAPDFFYGDPYVPPRNVEDWKNAHGTDKGFEDAKSVVAALTRKGITGIGAAGFCWGAKVVVELAKSPNIQAAVLLHPSLTTTDDIKEVKTPMSILGAEIDRASPPELLRQFEDILSTNKVESIVKIFPGVSHGWTVRYNDDDEAVVQCAKEAHRDMLSWFVKHVK